MALPKIAILAHTHPSVTRGGAEISAHTLYMGLKALGHDAVFIAACPARDRGKVLVQSDDEYIVTYEPREYDAFYHIAPPSTTAQVEALVQETGAEILLFHHVVFFGANTLRRLTDKGLRVALTLHEFLILCHHHGQMVTAPAQSLCSRSHPVSCAQCFPALEPAQFAARRQFLLDSLAGLTALISPSRFLMQRFIDWGFPAERFHFIENGLIALMGPVAAGATAVRAGDPVRSLLPSGSAALPGDERPLVIGFFGQLNPFKGVDVILDAAERLREAPARRPVKFRIHGAVVSLTQALQERFEAAVAADILEYRGSYENADVVRLMADCDYVLMASRWWENSPVVIQEAFAAGRPLIVPGIGGMAEKVADGVSGFHFRVGDSADLARVVRVAAASDSSQFVLPKPGTPSDMASQYLAALRLSAEPAENDPTRRTSLASSAARKVASMLRTKQA